MDTNLTNDERELLVMLLQKEEKNLHIEIDHSIHREFRNSFKNRLHTVTILLDKFRVADPVIPEYGFM